MEEKRKYLEYFEGAFDSTVAEKRQPQKWPYVAYSKTDGVVYTIIPKEEGTMYTIYRVVKKDISNCTYNMVDLGLSVKWADRNVGAQTEEDYGTYFSWGNTDGYTVSDVKLLTVEEACIMFGQFTGVTPQSKEELETMLTQIGFSVEQKQIGIVEGYSFNENSYATTKGAECTSSLDAQHDAATFNMGSDWRLPTSNEYIELIMAIKTSETDTERSLTCQYEYLNLQGVKQTLTVYRDNPGYYMNISGLLDENNNPLYSRILGIRITNTNTGAYIYIPASGIASGSTLSSIGVGAKYQSSSYMNTRYVEQFMFNPEQLSIDDTGIRYWGYSARGVQA